MTAPDREAPSTSWAVWAWQAYRDGRLVEASAAPAALSPEVADDVYAYAIDVSEAFDTMMEVERNPTGAWQAIQALAGHIAALRGIGGGNG